jgi:LAO/AO transport system kinase
LTPADAAIESIVRGDHRAGARMISRIEAGDASAEAVVRALSTRGGRTPIAGFTGPPGSGKSTLIDQVIARCRREGERVAVLAVDPSSIVTGGALLGDRVRMGRHNADPGVFVRSQTARGRLGGLAAATCDSLVVLDAMGFDRILIETVGVGQSEMEIVRHAHTVVVVQTTGAGDAVQAIKAGLLEIGDVFAVNKSDLPDPQGTLSVLREAVAFRHAVRGGGWSPPVLKTQATDGGGVDELLEALRAHWRHLQDHPAEQMLRRAR